MSKTIIYYQDTWVKKKKKRKKPKLCLFTDATN